MTKTISAGRSPKIHIHVIGGDLSLVGWESDEILLKGDDDQTRASQNGDEVKLSCDDDVSIRVPKAASVGLSHRSISRWISKRRGATRSTSGVA